MVRQRWNTKRLLLLRLLVLLVLHVLLLVFLLVSLLLLLLLLLLVLFHCQHPMPMSFAASEAKWMEKNFSEGDADIEDARVLFEDIQDLRRHCAVSLHSASTRPFELLLPQGILLLYYPDFVVADKAPWTMYWGTRRDRYRHLLCTPPIQPHSPFRGVLVVLSLQQSACAGSIAVAVRAARL